MDKVEAIKRMSAPRSRTGVRSFLGMTSFFRKFIPKYAEIARPMTILTSDKIPFSWGPEQQTSFDTLKDKLCKSPVLAAPDFSKSWYLITDASGGAIGAWLAQRKEGTLHPIAYHSRQLKKHEIAWTMDAMECEVLAIFDSLKKFRPFLYGARLVILSDIALYNGYLVEFNIRVLD